MRSRILFFASWCLFIAIVGSASISTAGPVTIVGTTQGEFDSGTTSGQRTPECSIKINFDNTPQFFSYARGTFTFDALDMPNLHVQSAFENLNALITATRTPESASLFLVGSGLAIVAWTIRRKKRSGADR